MYNDKELDRLNDVQNAAWYRWYAAFAAKDTDAPELQKAWGEAADALTEGLEAWTKANAASNVLRHVKGG